MDNPGNLTADGEALARRAAQRLYDAVLFSPTSKVAILLAGAAMVVAVVFCGVAGSKPLISSRKAQQAKAMREAYKSMEGQASLSNIEKDKVNPTPGARRSGNADFFRVTQPQQARRK
jgi:hypothetical protein